MKNSIELIREKALAGKFIDVGDIAFLVRQALKSNFKGCKFSVRTDHNSIRVSWQDGPASNAVNEVIGVFQTKGFDGFIDLSYCKKIWIYADGSATTAHVDGTQECGGYVPEYCGSAKSGDAVLADNVQAVWLSQSRNITPEFRQAIIDELSEQWGREYITAGTYRADQIIWERCREVSR